LSKIILERETVEEVFNDVMFDVWRYAEKFRGDSKPATWIFGIARNKALNALRQQKGKDVVDIETTELESDARDNPHASTEQSELNEKIKGALRHLSSEHREVIELTFYQGFSYSEIASIVNCPVNTVKTRMFHARRTLRGLLEKIGLK
jgi:RNA polymerase sigma-70 factor (ECF subfamily)